MKTGVCYAYSYPITSSASNNPFCTLETKREKSLHWLFPGDPEEKHKDIRKKRHEGTGKWFFEKKEFRDWLREPGSWLFCHGKGILLWLYHRFIKGKTLMRSDYIYSWCRQNRFHVCPGYFLV